jgi:hypothetical protein
LARTGLAVAGLLACGCSGFVADVHVSREARLTGKVESTSRRADVPCTVTATVFGHDDVGTATAPGRDVSVRRRS